MASQATSSDPESSSSEDTGLSKSELLRMIEFGDNRISIKDCAGKRADFWKDFKTS